MFVSIWFPEFRHELVVGHLLTDLHTFNINAFYPELGSPAKFRVRLPKDGA